MLELNWCLYKFKSVFYFLNIFSNQVEYLVESLLRMKMEGLALAVVLKCYKKLV